MTLHQIRHCFHEEIVNSTARLGGKDQIPNIADRGNPKSVLLGRALFNHLGYSPASGKLDPNTLGKNFETAIANFCESALHLFKQAHVGEYQVARTGTASGIGQYSQYSHLPELKALAATEKRLRLYMTAEYEVKPDICIVRRPLSMSDWSDDESVRESLGAAAYSPTISRERNPPLFLDSVVSCKWTIRSDRAQNVRTEALNLIRNRKGPLPSILVVTFEPLPSRLVSIARGTGDIDCAYHAALPELIFSVDQHGSESDKDLLMELVEGGRLRDIADLAVDLVF